MNASFHTEATPSDNRPAACSALQDSPTQGTIRLREIAHARSGDKGNHANIGVIAYTSDGFEFIGRELTPERVAAFLAPARPGAVRRFALPGIRAYNFLIENVLDGGASRSLRTDCQGKVLAQVLLNLELPAPDSAALATMRRSAE